MQASQAKAESSGSVTVGRSIFNLVKNIVGAGILAIPGGVTAFSQSRTAVYPTAAIIVALGSMSGYCFRFVGVGLYIFCVLILGACYVKLCFLRSSFSSTRLVATAASPLSLERNDGILLQFLILCVFRCICRHDRTLKEKLVSGQRSKENTPIPGVWVIRFRTGSVRKGKVKEF